MERIDSICTVDLTAVSELTVLDGKYRDDRYRLDDGRGLDLIEELLTCTQDLRCLTCLPIICTIGDPLYCRGT
jgi:hypothetical protein